MRKFLILLILSITLGGIAFYYFYPRYKETKNYGVVFPEAHFVSVGLDVSHHQGKINWDKLFRYMPPGKEIKFVYAKATEGDSHLDRKWKNNRKWLNNNLVKNGAYHFFSGKSYPIPQAKHFLKHYQYKATDLPPVLDVETEGISDKDLRLKMSSWLLYVEKQTGVKPIIYTSSHFYETKFKNHFKDYQFWIASYSRIPNGYKDKRVIHWQFTEKAIVVGTREKVDLNVSKLNFSK